MKKIALFLSMLLFIGITAINAQTKNITGKVTSSEDGLPIPGVSVMLKGTTLGTVTNSDGEYKLQVPKDGKTLIFSFVGMEKTELLIKGTTVDAALKSESIGIDEVMVTAGGIMRTKREQGYTSTKVTAEELTAGKSPTISGGLTAKVPGLQINAISSGVNPNYRLVLRGNRSLTGDNTVLIVIDNAVASSAMLNNINPEDVENIQVLSGAAGATLYGSEASNGVLLVTTKKGKAGKSSVKVTNTTTLEQVNFFPKLQNKFGQGTKSDGQYFDPVENQQFGPAFDGSLRELGYPLENGDQQYVTYEARDDRKEFWETGVQNQTDIAISMGTEKSTSYISGQYMTATGTTPGDKYDRKSIRYNGTANIFKSLSVDYTANYVENGYDITNATASIYDQLCQTSANIPLLSYKDYENNIWATPDGWYNPWYRNPYWTAAKYRQDTKNSYVIGKFEMKWKPVEWMYVLYRGAINNRYLQSKSWTPKFTYSDYSISVQGKTNLSGSVSDQHYHTSRVNHDFQLGFNKEVQDLDFNLILGYSYTDNTEKFVYEYASGLVIPDLYNISNRTGDATVSQYDTHKRNYGVWGDLLIGYKKFLFLHVTGRNDWTSLLAKANRSYFYPSVDASFLLTDAIADLKDSPIFSYIKIRGALSKTGNVNVDPYALDATFGSVTGYSNGTYFSQSSTLVSSNLKPEITNGWEVGTEFRLYDDKIDGQFNYYYTSTTGQAIEAGVAPSSAYSNFLINTGEVTNRGIETALHITPIRTKDIDLTIGGNYTHNKNMLVSLNKDFSRISINGSSVIYAEEGYELNQIIVTDYTRDDEGRVIVDPNTGYPSVASESKMIGNTSPKHRLGLDLSFRWKNFTLTNLFEYRGGYYAAAIALGSSLDFSGASARSAYYNRERFVFPNSSYLDESTGEYVDNTSITVSDGGAGFWTNSSRNRGVYSNYVFSANYWKWREIALTYDIPKSVLSKLPAIQAASISVQGRNLLLLTPASNEYTDPDYSANDNNAIGVSTLSQTPPTRYFGAAVSITF